MAVQLLSLTRASDGMTVVVGVYLILQILPHGSGALVVFDDPDSSSYGQVIVTQSPAAILAAANA